MPGDDFANALKGRREIHITVTGRRTGKTVTIPVWFVADNGGLSLLPVHGSRTQWYKNLEINPAITIEAGGQRRDFHARLLEDKQAVGDVVAQFREKYTPEEIQRWYSGLDAAVRLAFSAASRAES